MWIVNNLLIVFITINACDKEEIKKTDDNMLEISTHRNDTLDIDEDGIPDIITEYYTYETLDEPTSSRWIAGKIRPLDKNKMLYKSSMGYIFLEKGDTVSLFDHNFMRWTKSYADVVSINWDIDQGWDNSWTVTTKISEPYYIAILLDKVETSYIGLIHVLVNLDDGKIEFGRVSITEEDFIIVGDL